MQAVIGLMGRIAGRSAGMRITIAGMRIRISARTPSRIQGTGILNGANSWLNSSPRLKKAKHKTEGAGS